MALALYKSTRNYQLRSRWASTPPYHPLILVTFPLDPKIGSGTNLDNYQRNRDHVLSRISLESVTFFLMWRPLDIKHCLVVPGTHGYSHILSAASREQVGSSIWSSSCVFFGQEVPKLCQRWKYRCRECSLFVLALLFWLLMFDKIEIR